MTLICLDKILGIRALGMEVRQPNKDITEFIVGRDMTERMMIWERNELLEV